MNNLPAHIAQIITSALEAVSPEKLISNSLSLSNNILSIKNELFDLSDFENIYIIGAGKASAFMAWEIEKLLGSKITSGCISTNSEGLAKCNYINVIKASHPIPDRSSLEAGNEIMKIADHATENDLVICLISGGGSSLIESLPSDISLEDFKIITDLLIKSGADINEINAVRSSISKIKGGQLAEAIYPAMCVSLIISDVIGDKLETIASGPTFYDNKSVFNAYEVLLKYNLVEITPHSVVDYLKSTKNNLSQQKGKVYNLIIGNNMIALEAAKFKAEELGYNSIIVTNKLGGNVAEAASRIVDHISSSTDTKQCYLFGGETTVQVSGDGLGGRNQELTLHILSKLKDSQKIFTFASIGTDGKDGPTDAAGAYIDHNTWAEVIEQNLTPEDFLKRNDSYNFFKQLNSLIKTGPTKTNVMDIQILLIE